MIKVICAWCKEFIRLKDAKGVDTTRYPESHGICPCCYDKMSKELPE
jgi:hypothetical protein